MSIRIRRLQEKLKEASQEALLITHPANRRYISGFTGSSGIVLVTTEEAFIFTDFRYQIQAAEQAPACQVLIGDMWQLVGEKCQELKLSSLAFEADYLTFSEYKRLEDHVGNILLKPGEKWVESLRMIKDEEELQLIRRAAQIADEAFDQILKEIRPGISEREIAFRLEVLMRERGASSSSFDMIVASGVRSALPHGTASDKLLEKGDLLTLDFGAYYKGYASDLTRTVVLGHPSEKQKEIYEIVLEACNRTIQALKPGMTGKEVDAIARDYIDSKGYGEYFGHSTGHGIGLEVHEDPHLSSRRGDLTLQPGMVVTIEPGIYLPDLGGVRIEDDVLITETGCEVLTHSDKNLIILD